jgi:hypothetical protein
MRWPLFAGTVLLLSGLASLAAEHSENAKYSGKFDSKGRRLEEQEAVVDADGNKANKQECKSIEQWGEQVRTARSQRFKVEAARALAAIAKRNSDPQKEELAAGETAQLRTTCEPLWVIEDLAIRDPVVTAFASAADKSSVSTLKKILTVEADKGISGMIILALRRIGDDASVEALKELAVIVANERAGRVHLQNWRDFSTVDFAVASLKDIGSAAARKALEELYQSDDPILKEAAAETLDELDAKK